MHAQWSSLSVLRALIDRPRQTYAKLFYYSAQSLASAEYWIHFTERFGGVHAIGYNSAESKQIWMKS